MSSFSDRIYESLYITEGFVPTIYKDSKGIPTIGVGYALLVKGKDGKYKPRENIDYFYETMNYSPEQKSAVEAALLAAQNALNGVSGAVNPFKSSSALLWGSNHTAALNAEIAKYGSVGTKQQFKTNFWDTDGSIFQEYFTKVKNFIGDSNWNQLTEDEQVALYSIYYNGAAGSKIKAAINLLTENGTKSTSNKNELTDKQYIGYLNFLYEIVYNSNKNNTEAVQNRRFFEAREAIGKPLTSLPSNGNVSLTIPVENLTQANIVIAFMNQNKDAMKNKLDNITNYQNNSYKYIRDNFSSAVSTFLSNQNYTQGYDINTLFTEWNLYTDLQVNTSTGTTSYGNITGSDKRDLIFITGEQDETTVYAGAGNDEIFGGVYDDTVYCGSGEDHVKAGKGENYIDLGQDEDKDSIVIDNDVDGVDTLSNLTSRDEINCVGGFNLTTLQQVGNDVVLYGNNGNKIIFKDINLTEDGDLMPILKQDDGTVLYWKNDAYTTIKPNPYAFDNSSEELISALMSKLAYENLNTGFDFNNLSKTKFSLAEIDYLKNNYTVENNRTDTGLGFYGYILKNTQTGTIYYAIRGADKLMGTTGAEDWDIPSRGMAIEQFVAAYNFYVEALTPQGITAAKIVISNQEPEGIRHVVDVNQDKYYYLENFTGTNSEINSSTTIRLTGSSLGGHLAGILSHCTGKESIIFNAPKYNETITPYFRYNSGSYQYPTPNSAYSALVGTLIDGSYARATQIYNDDYFQNNTWGTRWNTEKSISEVKDFTSAQLALDCIYDTYYTYNTIKDIIDDTDILGGDNASKFAFTLEITYKAYCLATGKPYTAVSLDNSFAVKSYADEIANWRQQINHTILIDNHDANYQWSVNGTGESDLVFLGNAQKSFSAIGGNDIVYAIDINKASGASTSAPINRQVDLGSGSDTFYGFDSNDTINGGSSDTTTDINIIYLGRGSDEYTGGKGVDIVDGGTGATGNINKDLYKNLKALMTDLSTDTNTVDLGDGDDIYYCGAGTDIVKGGKGYDTFFWTPDGNLDSIIDSEQNEVVFSSGISKSDIIAESDGSLRTNFYIDPDKQEGFSYNGNTSSLKLSFADNPNDTFVIGETGLTFVQKDTDESIYGTSGNDIIYGNGGNDTMNADKGNDTIYGGIGNDTLKGGEGDDKYVYNLGDGFDTITDTGGNDKIKFGEGISQNDLSFGYVGRDLKILINNDETAGIQISSHFRGNVVETIEFHDGSTLDITNADQLIQAMNSFSVSNSASTDTLFNPTQDVSDMYSLAANQGLTRKAI